MTSDDTTGSNLPGLEDPRVQQMVCNAMFDLFTVDDWVKSKTAPSTIKLTAPRGIFYLTKNKKAYAKLLKKGAVVFSPLEVRRFLALQQKCRRDRAARLEAGEEEGEELISHGLVLRIFDCKRIFGAKLDEMIAEVPE